MYSIRPRNRRTRTSQVPQLTSILEPEHQSRSSRRCKVGGEVCHRESCCRILLPPRFPTAPSAWNTSSIYQAVILTHIFHGDPVC